MFTSKMWMETVDSDCGWSLSSETNQTLINLIMLIFHGHYITGNITSLYQTRSSNV